LEERDNVGPLPHLTEDDHLEERMDVPDTNSKPQIVAPYPKSSRGLRSLSFGTLGPAPIKTPTEFKSHQINHVGCIEKQVLPESKDKACQSKFAKMQTASGHLRFSMMVVTGQKPTKTI
jgi:hypothetical protein